MSLFGLDLFIFMLLAKKVLIVYAHQSPASFNAAAKNVAVEVLTAKGYTVEVSDLYAMKFKATATTEDITGAVYSLRVQVFSLDVLSSLNCWLPAGDVKNAEHFCYGNETKLAWEEGKLSADITEEQRKVTEADLIVFQVQLAADALFVFRA